MSASGTKQTFLFAPPMSAKNGFYAAFSGHLLQLNAFDFAKLRQTTMDYDWRILFAVTLLPPPSIGAYSRGRNDATSVLMRKQCLTKT